MNNCDVSFYENVPNTDSENEFSQEAIKCVLDEVLSVVAVQPPSLVHYCPFCILTFSHRRQLKSHLKQSHTSFLWELTSRSVEFLKCPLCPGKLAGNHLVAKHSLHTHGTVLVDAFFPKTEKYVKCIFCEALCESKLMGIHLETHPLEFVEWFGGTFPLVSGGVVGLVKIEPAPAKPIQIESLQMQLEQLAIPSSSAKPKSILKTPQSSKSSKLPVRRVLKFSDGKENDPETPRSQVRKTSGSSGNLSWNSAMNNAPFKCGKCSLNFNSRTKLSRHIKSDHRRLLVLHPLYQCSLCNAKFFKGSFLEKHCFTHSGVNGRPLR